MKIDQLRTLISEGIQEVLVERKKRLDERNKISSFLKKKES